MFPTWIFKPLNSRLYNDVNEENNNGWTAWEISISKKSSWKQRSTKVCQDYIQKKAMRTP